MPNQTNTSWTEPLIEILRDLWSQDLSTSEIGIRMNLTKNAIVGKAHRLGLISRLSPIQRDTRTPEQIEATRLKALATQERYRRSQGVKPRFVPLMASEIVVEASPQVVSEPVMVVPTYDPGRLAALARIQVPAVRPMPVHRAPDPPPRPRPFAKPRECLWPIGEPGAPGFHFCCDTPLAGRSYCEGHCEIAYVRVRDRREDRHAD